TYRELQRAKAEAEGAGPWDRGLTLLVDSSAYGPQVHAIHRVLVGIPRDPVLARTGSFGGLEPVSGLDAALARLADGHGFAVVLTDGERFLVLSDAGGQAGRPA